MYLLSDTAQKKKKINVTISTTGKSTGVFSQRQGFKVYMNGEDPVCYGLIGLTK